jgi:hypothetical protein
MLHQYTAGDSATTSRLQMKLYTYFIKSYANTFVNLPYNQIWKLWWFICLAANTFRCYSVEAICNTINVCKRF